MHSNRECTAITAIHPKPRITWPNTPNKFFASSFNSMEPVESNGKELWWPQLTYNGMKHIMNMHGNCLYRCWFIFFFLFPARCSLSTLLRCFLGWMLGIGLQAKDMIPWVIRSIENIEIFAKEHFVTTFFLGRRFASVLEKPRARGVNDGRCAGLEEKQKFNRTERIPRQQRGWWWKRIVPFSQVESYFNEAKQREMERAKEK